MAGVLGQQHHPDLVHVSWQGPQQGQQPGTGEHRDVVHVDLVPRDAGVVDTQQRQHGRAERAGNLLGLPTHSGDHLVEGIAVVPRRPVDRLGDVAVPGFGVDQEHPGRADQQVITVGATARDRDVVEHGPTLAHELVERSGGAPLPTGTLPPGGVSAETWKRRRQPDHCGGQRGHAGSRPSPRRQGCQRSYPASNWHSAHPPAG